MMKHSLSSALLAIGMAATVPVVTADLAKRNLKNGWILMNLKRWLLGTLQQF